jgi:hypothetical protein
MKWRHENRKRVYNLDNEGFNDKNDIENGIIYIPSLEHEKGRHDWSETDMYEIFSEWLGSVCLDGSDTSY